MNSKLDSVQVLRALAAALVVFQHALMNWAGKTVAPGAAPAIGGMGEYGVQLFFCISGFIIAYTTSQSPPGLASARKFWSRRIWRIVPLYWIMTSVYLAKLLLSGHSVGAGEIVKSYLFIPYLNDQGLVQPILGQGWSLNAEMFFYLTFGLMFVLPRRWHAPGVAGLMAALVGARLAGLLGSAAHANVVYYWADPVILYFASGVIASKLAQLWRSRDLPALSQNAAAAWSTMVVVAYAATLPVHTASSTVLNALACLVPLWLCITARPGRCAPGWRPLVLAGDGSYSTYLTHGFLVGALTRVVTGPVAGWLGLGPLSFALVAMVLCSAAGYGCFLLLERPLNRMHRTTDSRPRLAPSPASTTLGA